MNTYIRPITFALLALFPALLTAQFDVDFQRQYKVNQAEAKFSKKDYAEARTSFLELAESAPDGEERALWQARSLIALALAEDDFEQALQHTEEIEDPEFAAYARLELLRLSENYPAIIENFGDASFVEWETELELPSGVRGSSVDPRAVVLEIRGKAFEESGDYERAVNDYVTAADYMNDSTFAANTLWTASRLASGRLNNDERAYEINLRISEFNRGGANYHRGLIAAVAGYRDRGDFDAAIKLLTAEEQQRGGFDTIESIYWANSYLTAAAKLQEAMGNNDRAIEYYQMLLEHEQINDNLREQTEAQIAELQQGS